MDSVKVLRFLSDLKEHNEREWFNDHKDQFLEVKEEVMSWIRLLIPAIQKFDASLQQLDENKVLFRIYRDVRFSKDKSPYKTHFGLFFAQGGRKSELPGYYLHIEPGKTFVGGGVYQPQKPYLQAIRNEIYYNSETLLSIMNVVEFSSFYSGLSDYGKLKRVPMGFSKEFKHAELLKHKHFVVDHHIPDSQVVEADFLTTVVNAFEALYPFNTFLSDVR